MVTEAQRRASRVYHQKAREALRAKGGAIIQINLSPQAAQQMRHLCAHAGLSQQALFTRLLADAWPQKELKKARSRYARHQ